MIGELDADQWAGIIEAVEPATHAEVALELTERFGVTGDTARDGVDDALDRGVLAEDTSGAFGLLTVADDDETADETEQDTEADTDDTPDENADEWASADFTDPEPGVWPPAWEAREFWMARKGKKPYAPWGEPNNPDAPCTRDEHDADYTDECSCDARYKWSVTDNWADKGTVDEWARMDPDVDGHVVLLEKEDDPYTDDPDPFVFVDGDDVRCPETGEVHPEFVAILEKLGFTYADVSTSGAGVHALYEGQLPEGIKRADFEIDTEPWGENDDAPGVEIYDGKRVCVVTGEHIPGSADDVHEWDADAAESILEEHVPEEDRHTATHDTDRETPELDDYEPNATGGDETTEDIRDVFAAIDRLDAYDLPLRTQQVGTDGTGWEKWDPSTYRSSSGNDSLHTPDRKAWFDQKTGHSFGLLSLFAAEQGIISKPWHSLQGSDFWNAVETARENGAPIPQLITTASNDAGGRFYETCEPPLTADAEPIDIDARRDAMTDELYTEFADRDDVTIWAHNPGEGKTTSAAIAAAERDRDHVVLLPKHENCREFQRDDVKPDGYFHLKGAAQPRDDHCMDAELAGEDCDRHIGDCPTMCPVYSELGSDHPTRQAFDALAGTVGVRTAHQILELSEREWHDDKCAWLQQWDHVDSADRIVTVHDYAPLKSVRQQGDVIVDDLQGSLIDESDVGMNELSRCQQALRNFAKHADTDRTSLTMEKLAEFVDDLVMVLSDADADSATFSDVDVPNFPDGYVRTFDSREEIPDDVPADAIEETTQREYVGEGGQYKKAAAYKATVPDLAETLAQAKRAYNDILLSRMRDGRWSDTPFCLDTVFAALAAAGADGRKCRVAAATADYLSQCPRCDSRLATNDDRLMCTEGGCGWTEGQDPLTAADDTPARIDAEPRTGEATVHGITTRRLPPADELPHPSNVLVLDATPRKAVTAALFGVGEGHVTIDGNDAYSLPNATVTQIADGAYHRSTLTDSLTARQRVQSAIERINDMHDDVIYVALQKAIELFEWPDGAEVMNYYALRGLDRPDADAVVCVGAPHPDENAMRADARVLSKDNPRIRSGGTELSTRNASAPPVYRKLNYTDADGEGRAVASKTYTGLTGDLFDAAHADEIEQAAHRNRPILATENDERHVYLLTNVATNLPIDRLTGFDAFLNPTEHHLDVRDSALDLLDAMADGEDSDGDYAADGGVISIGATVSEWHEVAQEAGMDVSKSTISRALADLRDCGLVKEGRYAQRRGKLQTLTELGARVAAR